MILRKVSGVKNKTIGWVIFRFLDNNLGNSQLAEFNINNVFVINVIHC
jgi:ABC-type transport system involved in Fe-S cluster assembly fused permease/ATPase subunit